MYRRAGGTSGCRFLLGNGGFGMLRLRAHTVRPYGRGAIRRTDPILCGRLIAAPTEEIKRCTGEPAGRPAAGFCLGMVA